VSEESDQPSTERATDRGGRPDVNVSSSVNVARPPGTSKRVSTRQRIVQRDERTVVSEERTVTTTEDDEAREERDTDELSLEELESEEGTELPDREAMSLLDASVAIPVNPAVAANVLAEGVDAEPEPDPGPEHAGDPENQTEAERRRL
jgi:hypothetical protein